MKRRNFIRATGMFPLITGSLASKLEAHPATIKATGASDEPAREFYDRPADAWAGDFIPLFAEGKFQLFYLLDWRDREKHGEGTPWYRVSTTDFVGFEEHGQMLPRGTKQEQDLYVFTGSAIEAQGQYHIFYTGHNPYLRQQGKPEQGVMHAVSSDLQHWEKKPGDTFFAPAGRYEPNDWRDAFVFFNEETKEYNMLLAARHTSGIPRRRGLTALCASKDLSHWEVRGDFYAPNLFFTHECPDLFKMGEWWYLLFSEFTDLVATRYRMSRSLKGPWITPSQDTFDGHAFYAAKTASNGKDRFIFGWNPTRSDNSDAGSWNWGGNLVVHQLVQDKNGLLHVRIPETISAAFTKPVHAAPATRFLDGTGTFNTLVEGQLPTICRLSATLRYDEDTRDFGCMLRCSDDLDKSYYLRFEPAHQRLVFDKWPRQASEVSQEVELERAVSLRPGTPIQVQLIVDGNKGVVYVDDKVAMNFRIYDLKEGGWGWFVTDGKITVTDALVKTR
jgi:beta-fructofuranosidase